MMSRKMTLVVVGVTTAATLAIGADWLHRPQPRRYRHLPCYEYRASRPTNPETRVTTVGLGPALTEQRLAMDIENGEVRRSLVEEQTLTKTFQLGDSQLPNDHCRLTRVTLTIVEDGSWIFHFRAEQNPDLVGEQQRPQYERFERNRFYVTVRGVGAGVVEPVQNAVLGKPEYFKICLKPFAIEKREVRILRFAGYSEEVERFFQIADFVEVDLRYD